MHAQHITRLPLDEFHVFSRYKLIFKLTKESRKKKNVVRPLRPYPPPAPSSLVATFFGGFFFRA